MRVFVAGFQHETNTFAPSLADWAAFNRGDGFPPFMRGPSMLDTLRDVNIPVGGFAHAAASRGWTLVPSAWAGASPSSYVTRDAFERIAGAITEDLQAALRSGIDAVYLDLHGAAVAEHADDAEGELLTRVRALIGDAMPLVASLDLHANVTRRMLETADALTSYRTYPHIDMADTGARAAELLARRVRLGHRLALCSRRLPFLISLNAQSTWIEPARTLYRQLAELDAQHGASLNFCMGFPASDFDECAPVVWGYADTVAPADAATEALYAAAAEPAQWRLPIFNADAAAQRALDIAGTATQPVVIADTEDNPGAGGDSNTTGLLRALLAAGAGRRHPQRVAIGMLFDPETAQAACNAGVGAVLERAIGKSVPTYMGVSDAPVQGRFVVRATSGGQCTLKGPMMTGAPLNLGPSACLEVDGILVAVVSGKAQLLDRVMLEMVGIDALQMKIIAVKSSNHFRADFTPIASEVLVAKANGPMAASPADLAWKKLNPQTRTLP